jgi:hypothetical protein
MMVQWKLLEGYFLPWSISKMKDKPELKREYRYNQKRNKSALLIVKSAWEAHHISYRYCYRACCYLPFKEFCR